MKIFQLVKEWFNGFSGKDVEDKVMDVIWHTNLHTAVCKNKNQCLNSLKEIESRLIWAKTLKGKERKYYLKWLKYCKGEHLQKLKEIKTEPPFKEALQKVIKEMQEKRERLSKINISMYKE
jgi:hypothetical protein